MKCPPATISEFSAPPPRPKPTFFSILKLVRGALTSRPGRSAPLMTDIVSPPLLLERFDPWPPPSWSTIQTLAGRVGVVVVWVVAAAVGVAAELHC
jgi:hypothetical protein